jgi:hypothetical protein
MEVTDAYSVGCGPQNNGFFVVSKAVNHARIQG